MASTYFARLAGLVAGLTLAGLGAVQAQSPEEFYKGKTITMVISAAPGGGADYYGRAIAPFWAKHIPGQPEIRITNLPGASGLKAAIQMQANGAKDGTEVAFLQRNNLYLPLVSEKPVAFDPKSVNWLGSISKEDYTVAVMASADAKNADDLFKTPVKMGATSFTNENRTLPAMMNEYFGTKFDIVVGFPSAKEATLALERGEIQGRMLPVTSILGYGNEAEWYKEGKIKVLLLATLKPNDKFPGVPNLLEFSKDPDAIALAKFMLAPMEASRPFAAPAGVPEDRVAALRKAFMDAVQDPDFLAELAKTNTTIDPISGQEVQDLVSDIFKTKQSVVDNVKALITPK